MAETVQRLAIPSPSPVNPLTAAKDVVALTKPSITAMAIIVAAGTWLLAASTSTSALTAADLLRGVVAMAGIAAAVMGAGALNMLIERDIDRLMARTMKRPLAARRLDPSVAFVVGAFLAVVSAPLLLASSNALTAGLAVFSLFVYVLVYTPMKRTSPWSLVVGALPGAMPALMGATASTGRLEVVGLSLFGIAFLWQLPHFLAISIYREREYVAAGHKIVPDVWGLTAARAGMLVTSLPLAVLGVALVPLGIGSVVFGVVAALLGAWFVGECAVAAFAGGTRADHNRRARRVFFASLGYQTLLFGALAVDAVVVALVG